MPLLVVSATRLLFQIKHLDGVLLLNHFIKLIERLIHIKEWIAILHSLLLLPAPVLHHELRLVGLGILLPLRKIQKLECHG